MNHQTPNPFRKGPIRAHKYGLVPLNEEAVNSVLSKLLPARNPLVVGTGTNGLSICGLKSRHSCSFQANLPVGPGAEFSNRLLMGK